MDLEFLQRVVKTLYCDCQVKAGCLQFKFFILNYYYNSVAALYLCNLCNEVRGLSAGGSCFCQDLALTHRAF